MREFKIIPIDQVTEPSDPMRFEMDDADLVSLTESVKAQGILEPLCVRPAHEYAYEIEMANSRALASRPNPTKLQWEVIAGHRRLLAARAAGLAEIPCIVFSGEDDNALAIMIAENVEREEVTAYEEGMLYAQIADLPGITEEQLKTKIKKPLGYIYARIDLVKGDPDVSAAVQRRQIVLGVARELNKVKHDGYRRMYLERALQGGCTVELAKSWVSQWRMASQGLSEAQQNPMQPLPSQEHIQQSQACWLCGGNDDPHNLEPVWIHREELRVLRMARDMQLQAANSGQGD